MKIANKPAVDKLERNFMFIFFATNNIHIFIITLFYDDGIITNGFAYAPIRNDVINIYRYWPRPRHRTAYRMQIQYMVVGIK